jgi:hypothetical protein
LAEFDPAGVDWGRVYVEALRLARELKWVSEVEADEIVQQGTTLVLEGVEPFDPDGGATLADHVVQVGKAARDIQRRVERRRRSPKKLAKLEHYTDVPPPTPEELSDAREEGDDAFEMLLASTEGSADLQALVALMRRDIDDPADQAAELGWKIGKVYNTRKRLKGIIDEMAEFMRPVQVEEEEQEQGQGQDES